jgi:hypothetical protein
VCGLVFYSRRTIFLRIPLAAGSQAWVCGLSFAGIAGSNPAGGAWMSVSCECCVYCHVGVSATADPSSRVFLQSVYVALSVIRRNNNPLQLQWVGRRRQTKKEYPSEKKTSWTYVTNADRYYTPAHSGIWLCPLDILHVESQSSVPLFHSDTNFIIQYK